MPMNLLTKEIEKRRTFGIVSHPDAGKTTLTEKLLLFGGAINVAGAVKSNKIKKSATSDFMEIEKQRGISVATSVMGFNYAGKRINILDTPGHQDFAEDTFRTLTAVDSVIMVIDCVKGVESQTEKLLKVCRMRQTPVITFINKMDREGQDSFDLLDEIENKLKIKVMPLSWPIGIGSQFKGIYSIYKKQLLLFKSSATTLNDMLMEKITDLNTPKLAELVGKNQTDKLKEDLEIVQGIYPLLDIEAYQRGEISPVFFGSAVNNFGVKELLDCFIEISPIPGERDSTKGRIQPDHKNFSGFIFKIHANMDPKHRDRKAFLRICSGKFERNKKYNHVRLEKEMKFSVPTAFMAQDKEIIEEAFPGDIIGLHDVGNFIIGDTLTEGENFFYRGIPNFSPEIFRFMVNKDPMKTKQLQKGIEQLMDEGVAQLFTMTHNNRKIIGTVGSLQFEVIKHRLLHEYGASCDFEMLDYYKACWIYSKDKMILEKFLDDKFAFIAKDKHDNPVFMAESSWLLELAQKDYPEVTFSFSSEVHQQKN